MVWNKISRHAMIPQPTINLSVADWVECERVRWYLIRITLIFNSTGPITLWSFAVIILYKSRLFDTAPVGILQEPQSLTGDGCCGPKRVLCPVHPVRGVDAPIISPLYHNALEDFQKSAHSSSRWQFELLIPPHPCPPLVCTQKKKCSIRFLDDGLIFLSIPNGDEGTAAAALLTHSAASQILWSLFTWNLFFRFLKQNRAKRGPNADVSKFCAKTRRFYC